MSLGRPRSSRRGNYAMMLAPLLVVMLGFTALLIDGVLLIEARAEARSLADAAAHAALIELRSTGGDAAAARARAELVLARNTVARQAPSLASFEVGTWDDRDPVPSFGGTPGNAVEVVVQRAGIPVWFASLWGISSSSVGARAVAASRGLHLVVAVDLDPAWTEGDMLAVRDGLSALFARLAATSAPDDRVALIVFHSRYSWVYQPMIAASASAGIAAALGPGSLAGLNTDPTDGVDCVAHLGADLDDFGLATVGGCFPSQPRVYSDEDGTDLAVALDHAAVLLADPGLSPPAARAVVVISRDGVHAIGAAAGAARAADGFTEARFAESTSPAGQAEVDLIDAAGVSAGALWDDLAAHVWGVTLGSALELAALPQGDGDLFVELDAAAMGARIPELVSAFPLGVVE